MNHRKATYLFVIVVSALLLGGYTLVPEATAFSSFFASRCDNCHEDDSITCSGCHRHRGSLNAHTEMPEYQAGQEVVVIFNGGSQSGGWVRAILYDADGVEIDRASGPTGDGDNGQGNPVVFPIQLQGIAPDEPGQYTWEAAWFGVLDNSSTHGEIRVPVSFEVTMDPAGVPEDEPGQEPQSWGRVKDTFR